MNKIQDIDSLFSLKYNDTLMTVISFLFLSCSTLDFPGGSECKKNLPAMQETWIWSLGWKDALEKGMATHSSIFVLRIP